MNTTLYFAYGSNMNHEQMRQRCPAARPVGVATLADYAFRINRHGVATVVPRIGSSVTGGLWRVTDQCLVALDRYEGVAVGLYTRAEIQVADADGRVVSADTYRAAVSAPGAPRDGYLTVVLAGAADFDMSSEEMERIAAAGQSVMQRRRVHELTESARRGETPRSDLWAGGHVIISDHPIPNPDHGFSRYLVVVTPWAAELSHVFREVTEVLWDLPGYGMVKRDWFARMGEAARRVEAAAGPHAVCVAALEEAARIIDGEPGLVDPATWSRQHNPFRLGTVNHAAAELLFQGGRRRDLAMRLAEMTSLHPWTKSTTLADFDKRLLLTASLLRRRFGFVEHREGRGLKGTIRVVSSVGISLGMAC